MGKQQKHSKTVQKSEAKKKVVDKGQAKLQSKTSNKSSKKRKEDVIEDQAAVAVEDEVILNADSDAFESIESADKNAMDLDPLREKKQKLMMKSKITC